MNRKRGSFRGAVSVLRPASEAGGRWFESTPRIWRCEAAVGYTGFDPRASRGAPTRARARVADVITPLAPFTPSSIAEGRANGPPEHESTEGPALERLRGAGAFLP